MEPTCLQSQTSAFRPFHITMFATNERFIPSSENSMYLVGLQIFRQVKCSVQLTE